MNVQGVAPWYQLAAKQAQDAPLPREQEPGVRERERARGCSSTKTQAEPRTRGVSLPRGPGVGRGAAAFKGCVLFSEKRVQQVSSRFGDLQRINLLD